MIKPGETQPVAVPTRSKKPNPKAVAQLTTVPDRQPSSTQPSSGGFDNISIRLPREVAARFRELCITERWSQPKMFAIFLDHYQNGK